MRANIVAGNWKMNCDREAAQKLASEAVHMAKDEVPTETRVVLCPPFVHLAHVGALIPEGSHISLGAQNCHAQTSGAFTGEVSAAMLKSYGVEYVILGHSERRELFKESDAQIAAKVDAVLANGMKPIFCCGEKLNEREAGVHVSVVRKQLEGGLYHRDAADFANIVIAYEPVWAIGTGVTASAGQAQEMHAEIRKSLAETFGEEVAGSVSILYGGSVKPGNAAELFNCLDVDGGLVGGASLKSRDFTDIGKAFAATQA